MNRLYICVFVLMYSSSYAGSEELLIETEFGSLSGILEFPDDVSSKAIFLIIAGSGPTDRDGNTQGFAGKNNSLKYLSDSLVDEGFATIRFDKRLIGKSSSNLISEDEIVIETYVEDASRWASYALSRFDVPLFLIGHSEGALIASLASKAIRVAGVISIAGAAQPASKLILNQLESRLPPELFLEAKEIVSMLKSGERYTQVPNELNFVFRESLQPYLISWFQYDPSQVVATISVPVLLVYGTYDIQVPFTESNLMNCSIGLCEIVYIEGMNHVLKHTGRDLQSQAESYINPMLPISKELINSISKFVKNEIE